MPRNEKVVSTVYVASEPPPCTPQAGYAQKDELNQWRKEHQDCERRRNSPGYATLMDLRYKGGEGD